MELETFVKELAAAAPSAADLERCGLSTEQARIFIKSFLCVKREHPLSATNGSDQLLELLRQWDLSKVEIGMMRFPNPPTERSGKLCVGCVEVDPLVILPDTGEVVVYELGTKEHLLCHVAKSGSKMLDAMVIAARFLEKCAVGTIDFDNYEAALSVALECASAAGGDRYLKFYKMLLGAEE
jgi:hypothetical protein